MRVYQPSDQIEIKRKLPQNSVKPSIKYIEKIRLCQTKDF
jgi:hypothetical protein